MILHILIWFWNPQIPQLWLLIQSFTWKDTSLMKTFGSESSSLLQSKLCQSKFNSLREICLLNVIFNLDFVDYAVQSFMKLVLDSCLSNFKPVWTIDVLGLHKHVCLKHDDVSSWSEYFLMSTFGSLYKHSLHQQIIMLSVRGRK